jgi:hypothetical protein
MATAGHTEDFDQSFEYFEGSGKGKEPWAEKVWGQNALDSSFDSAFEDGIFEFSATSSAQFDGDFDSQSFLFGDTFALNPSKKEGPVTVRLAMHEQVSALYDDASVDTTASIIGSIHVKPTTDLKGPFHVTIRDAMNHLERIEIRPDICRDVSEKISRKGLHESDRVLRVTLPPNSINQEIPIARYVCTPTLRPVPMVSNILSYDVLSSFRIASCTLDTPSHSLFQHLFSGSPKLVKSRVQFGGKFSRIGFKVRANPTNMHVLTRVVILLAVPPYVKGDKVRMSRKGGAWDELKRTISWTLDSLEPGEALEIQAQFESVDIPSVGGALKFPLLVRAEYPALFSSVEMNSDFIDALSTPIKIKLSQSGRVLHRKV